MLIYILYNFKGDFMNLKWNKNNIYAELEQLKREFMTTKDENQKYNIFIDIVEYLRILNISNPNFISKKDENKYNNLFKKRFQLEEIKFENVILNKKNAFECLTNEIGQLKLNLTNNIPQNKFIVDTNIFKYINEFLGDFDFNLYKNFVDSYHNGYINLSFANSNFYNAYCININTNCKSYINLFIQKPYYIISPLIHELGHSYENLIAKKDSSWRHNLNIYTEVFAIFLTLTFDDFISSTRYHNYGKYDIYDFIKTNFSLSRELKWCFKKNNFSLSQKSDLMYFYGSNIALALFEQYKIDKMESKKNINYFIQNNDVIFSDELLKRIDIDLDKLYCGDYYKEFCQKQKRL